MRVVKPRGTIIPDLTVRSLIIGLLGSVIITSSSMYVALRMGALPWPTLFAAVLSMSVLRIWGDATLREINVTHTVMSSGAMVAGGLAFTIPGIWILDPEAPVQLLPLMAVTISGAVLGVLFTSFHRRTYIVDDPLPFPMGTAAYQTLKAGEQGGPQARVLFSAMGLSAAFTYIRDGLSAIPAAISWKMPGRHTPGLSLWLSPMAAGIGFIIGPLYTGIWAFGAILGYLIIIPFGVSSGLFADAAAADLFRQDLGIGLMVGTGIGILLKSIYHAYRDRSAVRRSASLNRAKIVVLPVLLVTIGLWSFTDLNVLQILLAAALIWITTSMAAVITGQTAINPMEIFGILVILAVSLIDRPAQIGAFMIAALTAVACGLTGDVMNDLKAGRELGTDPAAQLIAEAAGSILGAIIAVLVLVSMKEAFGGFGTADLPAPQAAAVSQMISGLSNVPSFFIGCTAGALLYLLRLPTTTLGLGVYLPTSISTIVFAGGLMSMVLIRSVRQERRTAVQETGSIVASGFLGGEGIIGVLLAILSVF